MSVSLDGQALTVTKWVESETLIMSQYDQWSGGLCKRKQQVYGIVRNYQLDCIEQNVAWANSLVNYFEQKASAGTAVAFSSTIPQRAASANVYIQGVDWTAENIGTQNVRKFTLKLQEV
jgi:hypothetical protein